MNTRLWWLNGDVKAVFKSTHRILTGSMGFFIGLLSSLGLRPPKDDSLTKENKKEPPVS
jgi:hypothetical protein